MDSVEIAKYKGLLEDERKDVRHQLEENGADPDAGSFDGMDFDFGFADSAQSTAERNRILAFVEGLRERLTDIDNALSKLEKATFGLCERCGNPIAPERLEAIPHARLCASCKSKG
ncbi:MAG: TraR/DksA family transcriptional regulator [Actinomycetota bacterium]